MSYTLTKKDLDTYSMTQEAYEKSFGKPRLMTKADIKKHNAKAIIALEKYLNGIDKMIFKGSKREDILDHPILLPHIVQIVPSKK